MPDVRDNRDESRFEIYVDDQLAGYMTYRLKDQLFTALHTEVDDAYEGQGVGSQFVKEVLDRLRDTGLQLRPACPFVKAYIERHPEYAELVQGA